VQLAQVLLHWVHLRLSVVLEYYPTGHIELHWFFTTSSLFNVEFRKQPVQILGEFSQYWHGFWHDCRTPLRTAYMGLAATIAGVMHKPDC